MAHPLVEQLRFTRAEFLRCLDGLSLQDATVRHGQMNCISWTIGHLADHENRIFVFLGAGKSDSAGTAQDLRLRLSAVDAET